MNHARPVYLEGEQVGLAQLDPSDAAWLTSYMNAAETTQYMATGREPIAVAEVAAQIGAWKRPTDYAFAVLQKWDDYAASYQPIGYCGLFGLDQISRKAEFRILLGGIFCGKGFGTEATRLTLRFGFEHLNLHRVWLGVTSRNARAVTAYVRAGFQEEGRLLDDLYRGGRYFDSVRMAILRNRYDKEKDQWATEKVKRAATSAPGPSTAGSAAAPSTGSSQPAGG